MSELDQAWYNHQIAIVNRRNAELEQRIAALTLERDTLKAERDAVGNGVELLAEAIVDIGIEAGITDGMLPLDGPQLLLIASDSKAHIAALKAKVERLSAPVSDLELARYCHYMYQDGAPCLAIRIKDFDTLIAARASAPPIHTGTEGEDK